MKSKREGGREREKEEEHGVSDLIHPLPTCVLGPLPHPHTGFQNGSVSSVFSSNSVHHPGPETPGLEIDSGWDNLPVDHKKLLVDHCPWSLTRDVQYAPRPWTMV